MFAIQFHSHDSKYLNQVTMFPDIEGSEKKLLECDQLSELALKIKI